MHSLSPLHNRSIIPLLSTWTLTGPNHSFPKGRRRPSAPPTCMVLWTSSSASIEPYLPCKAPNSSSKSNCTTDQPHARHTFQLYPDESRQLQRGLCWPSTSISIESAHNSTLLWDTTVCFLHIQEIGTDIQIRKILRQKLMLNPANLLRKMRPGTTKACNPQVCLQIWRKRRDSVSQKMTPHKC